MIQLYKKQLVFKKKNIMYNIMRLKVLPSVIWRGQVIDWSTREVYVASIPLLNEEITIDIGDNPVLKNYNQIKRLIENGEWEQVRNRIGGQLVRGRTRARGVFNIGLRMGDTPVTPDNFGQFLVQDSREKQYILINAKRKLDEVLRNRILDAFEVALTDGVSVVDDSAVANVNSPDATYIYKENLGEWDDLSNTEKFDYLKSTTTAKFQVINDTDYLSRMRFGSVRLFRVDGRRLWNKDIFWDHKDESLTCAYDYIVGKYGNFNGTKKLASSKRRIDDAIELPQQQHKEIFREWKKQHSDDFRGEVYDGCLPQTIPVNELGDEWMKFYEENFEEGYSEKEIKDTLDIIDLVKWCIVADVRLNVLDTEHDQYLSYNPDLFREHYKFKTKKSKPTMSVVVKHRHAFFIEDKNIKQSLSLTDTLHTSDQAPPVLGKGHEDKNKEEKEVKFLNTGESDECDPETGIPYPPPLPQDLVLANSDNVVYYNNTSNLNGLAQYLYQHHKMMPIYVNGSLKKVKRLVYEGLTIESEDAKPSWMFKLEQEDRDELFKLYPQLKPTDNKMPSETSIAKAVWGDDNSYKSMLNGQVRKMFFNHEIKPEPRQFDCITNSHDSIESFDLTKAYTTCLETNKYEWNVFDSVCQFKKYRSGFNPSYFYLCYNRIKGYPCRGQGLTLYHGSEVEVMMDYLIIKYYIKPIRTLEPDYFVEYVNKVKQHCDDYQSFRDIGYKSLVNRFIGDMKGKEGVCEYKQVLTDCRESAVRQLVKAGKSVMKLNEGIGWRRQLMLCSKPNKRKQHSTGQPVRLAVLGQINRQLYLLYKHYRKCLYVYKFLGKEVYDSKLLGFKTDAMYISYGGYGFSKYLVKEWNKDSEYTIRTEGLKDPELWRNYASLRKTQLGARYIPNQWREYIDINHKWSKELGSELMLNTLISNGGGWFSGKGGRGKSEIVIQLKKIIAWNNIRLKWVKFAWKLLGKKNLYYLERDWRKQNPCSAKYLAPTNKASNNIQGQTINKGLGIPVTKSDIEDLGVEEVKEEDNRCFTSSIIENWEGSKKDFRQPLNILVFDEISQIGGDKWDVVSYLKHRMPELIIILCGDIRHQLKPVGDNREFEDVYVIKELANFVRINLNYNFREGTTTDKVWERTTYGAEDCIEPVLNAGTLPNRNLCWTNLKRKEIINIKQDELDNPFTLECKTNDRKLKDGQTNFLKFKSGTPLIARKSICDLGIAKNEMFIVAFVDNNEVALISEDTGGLMRIPMKDILDTFLSGYCITIHKSQGETYKDPYAIHDWNRLNKEGRDAHRLRYTAVSRSDDYQNKVLVIA